MFGGVVLLCTSLQPAASSPCWLARENVVYPRFADPFECRDDLDAAKALCAQRKQEGENCRALTYYAACAGWSLRSDAAVQAVSGSDVVSHE